MGEELGRLLFKFNILAQPDEASNTVNCDNNGRRIFFKEGTGPLGTIQWDWDTVSEWTITDCDGTNGTAAIDGPDVLFAVFVRLHGPLSSSLSILCNEDADIDIAEDLCLVGTVKRHKHTRFTQNLVADGLEGVTWTLDSATGYRNVDVRVYEVILP